MKIKLRAVVTFSWEEDSKDWDADPKTPEEILAEVKKYVEDDMGYILEADIDTYDIQIAE
jgi:hypothetical protein